jgi:hypothetical protein
VEGPAVPSILLTNVRWKRYPPLCHPGRSVAKWRDLLFRRSYSPTCDGSATLPFVIPTGAQRSGGTCCSVDPTHQRAMEAPPSPLSSRPERSEVEGPAIPSIPLTNVRWKPHPPLCHLDWSAAKWRDLLFRRSHSPTCDESAALSFVIPTAGRDLQSSAVPRSSPYLFPGKTNSMPATKLWPGMRTPRISSYPVLERLVICR